MESTTERVGVRELLEAGVHFGHQAKRWNPKMKRYIFAQRAGVHIIDLDQTLTLLERSLQFIRSVAEAGREVLFVGTKKQAQLTLAEQAMRCGQPYVAERYIGGMLTNFQTIQPRIQHFVNLAARVDETPEENRTGREWFALHREYQKLRRNFAGITEMERLPGAVFVVDPKREELLIKEANRLRIPVVALTDTNCDPEVVDYVIPGNDDAIRAINLISRLIADAVLAGSGEDEVPVEDRPVPPVIEEARISEEAAEASISEASRNGGVVESSANGVGGIEIPIGETSPEEDPTASETAETEQESAAPGEPVDTEPAEDKLGADVAAGETTHEESAEETPPADEPIAESEKTAASEDDETEEK